MLDDHPNQSSCICQDRGKREMWIVPGSSVVQNSHSEWGALEACQLPCCRVPHSCPDKQAPEIEQECATINQVERWAWTGKIRNNSRHLMMIQGAPWSKSTSGVYCTEYSGGDLLQKMSLLGSRTQNDAGLRTGANGLKTIGKGKRPPLMDWGPRGQLASVENDK
ncbi:hypothetical protein PENSUB_4542 [Penicillium subrubescens]|uniref:Uncharacterized protein n=1 Tax=Penicillium subrubescens TaxID=1316194 RepID=A0A1Q5UC76_9EURO|nr:hypothetical protein PENSUB_4542 [Penicillium subrubescens]